MSRKAWLTAGWIALAAVLAGLMILPVRKPGNVVALDERPGAPLPARETTLRNVTREPLTYRILPSVYGPKVRSRTLAVGALDRIRTDAELEIAFDNKARSTTVKIGPGQPYSFRYDEGGRVHLYPGSHGREDASDLAPYVPTPPDVVDAMLRAASVGPGDVVYDLGCGDGRMVVAAAKRFGARGVGVELDADMLRLCRENAERDGVAGRVRFLEADAAKVRLTEATVLSLYLLPESLEDLRPRFEADLRPGARVVSHNYKVPGWDARLRVTDEVTDATGSLHNVFLYVR